MREDGVGSQCETGLRSLGKRACRTAPRYAQRRFMASWPHCNLATGLRGFSPLVFSGEFHTPRLPEALQAVHRNAHPRPLGIHFHILWYRPNAVISIPCLRPKWCACGQFAPLSVAAASCCRRSHPPAEHSTLCINAASKRVARPPVVRKLTSTEGLANIDISGIGQ